MQEAVCIRVTISRRLHRFTEETSAPRPFRGSPLLLLQIVAMDEEAEAEPSDLALSHRMPADTWVRTRAKASARHEPADG